MGAKTGPSSTGASSARGIAGAVPGIDALRTYESSWLRSDLVAGIVLATILVPQGMAYAELAGLPAVTGLYTTITCLVAYAFMGPSRILVLGPDSSVSPLIMAAILPLLAGGGPETAIILAGMLALLVGAVEIGLGVAKLGFIADLLSKEVQTGYMNGLAIVIIVSQLPKLFGFSTDADSFVSAVQAFVTGLDATNATTLAIGLGTLAILVVLPLVTKKIPAVLVAVVAATVVVGVFGLDEQGVDIVGDLPRGLPRPSFPWTNVGDLGPLLMASLGIVLVSLTDTLAASTSFAARRGEEVDPNREMIGIGTANIAAGLFQGFAISASTSRTAVAFQAGTKSQVTGLIGAAIVAVLLIFLPSLTRYLPQTALAAVVIAAAFILLDLKIIATYARVRKTALLTSLVATLGVVFFGVLTGIFIAVVLAILVFFRRAWWPPGKVLGRDPRTERWHDIERHTAARQVNNVIVFRWEAPLFFANAGIFREQVRELIERSPAPRWVVLQCEAITDIDVTAGSMLKHLDRECNAAGIHLVFVDLRGRLKDLLQVYGLMETFDHRHFFYSVDEAIESIRAEDAERDKPDSGDQA